MPVRQVSQSIAAGATFDPMDTWQYQYTEKAGVLTILDNATATGLRRVVTATEVTLVQDSPVPAGGTAGVFPSPLNVPIIAEKVGKGKRLSIVYTNNTGGAITVNVTADLTYGKGR